MPPSFESTGKNSSNDYFSNQTMMYRCTTESMIAVCSSAVSPFQRFKFQVYTIRGGRRPPDQIRVRLSQTADTSLTLLLERSSSVSCAEVRMVGCCLLVGAPLCHTFSVRWSEQAAGVSGRARCDVTHTRGPPHSGRGGAAATARRASPCTPRARVGHACHVYFINGTPACLFSNGTNRSAC